MKKIILLPIFTTLINADTLAKTSTKLAESMQKLQYATDFLLGTIALLAIYALSVLIMKDAKKLTWALKIFISLIILNFIVLVIRNII